MNLFVLQNLIRSMTKSESRTFSKMVALKERKNNYIALFEYLLNAKSIDTGELESRYGKHGLEAARKYLAKLLMNALRAADDKNGLENSLIDLLKDAQILHRKGFIKECFELLAKVKVTALKNERYSYYLIAARLELGFLARIQFAGVNEFELMQKQKSIAEILDHEVQFHRHASLQEILLSRYWRKGIIHDAKEKAKLNDLLLEEFNILNNRNYRSFESQHMHLNFQSVYFLMIGEHGESLKIFYELNALFQKNEALWADTPAYYIALLDGILTDLFAMGRYAEMGFFIDQLNNIPKTSDDLSLQVELLNVYYRLSILNQDGLYEAGKMMIEEHWPHINHIVKNPSSNLQAQLSLIIALTYFNNHEYKACAKLLNTIFNLQDSITAYETYNQLSILYLMTQYELGNYDYLPYQIRSFERKLNTEKQYGEIEKVFISVIKQLCANPGICLINAEPFLNKVNLLDEIPYYARTIQKLQLKKWIATKTQRLTGK